MATTTETRTFSIDSKGRTYEIVILETEAGTLKRAKELRAKIKAKKEAIRAKIDASSMVKKWELELEPLMANLRSILDDPPEGDKVVGVVPRVGEISKTTEPPRANPTTVFRIK